MPKKRTRKTTTYRVSPATITMVQELLDAYPNRYRSRTHVVEAAVEELYQRHLDVAAVPLPSPVPQPRP